MDGIDSLTCTLKNQIQVDERVRSSNGKLLMPRLEMITQFTSTMLHSEWDSYTGPEFARSYRKNLSSAPRPARSSDQADLFPSRLFGPDGVTFKTSIPCPEYVVISYTWGRWKLRTRDQDTELTGCHWMVPANGLFSRTDLDTAVRKISRGRSAWLDVFCIPQIDKDAEHSKEIGKQGEIFRSASHAAVWLCSGGDQTLAEICSWVPEEIHMLKPDILHEPTYLDLENGTADFTETRRRLNLIVDLATDVPWTTSLWTLQEAALRLDATFYDKGGNPVLHRATGNPLTIRHLVKTLRHIKDVLSIIGVPDTDSIYHVLGNTEEMNATTSDVDLWFRAIDTVNQINLHNLISMNAGQLLLTSSHRTCKRPHDRVYGIMGAIGTSMPVDYNEDPAKVMRMFLVNLHNEFPAEIQAFQRESFSSPNICSWLADENCRELGLIRQLTAPSSRPFTGITSENELIVNQLLFVSKRGLLALTTRFLSETVAAACDKYAFSDMSNGRILAKETLEAGRGSYVLMCNILQVLATEAQLGLIPLGSIQGLESLGWQCAYMLVASSHFMGNPRALVAEIKPRFQRFRRLGILVLTDELSVDEPVSGEFHIY